MTKSSVTGKKMAGVVGRYGMQLICLWSVSVLVTLVESGVSSSRQLTSALPRHRQMAHSRCGLSLTSLVSEYVAALLLLTSATGWNQK